MKRLIPYLLFSAATLHTFIGISPVIAMGCKSHHEKIEVIFEKGGINCQEKILNTNVN